MIIDYLHIIDIALFPNKTDAPPVIDPDAILPLAVSSEGFQAIPGRKTEVLDGF